MRICYFSSSYLRHRGGAEQHVHRLAEELCRLGHEVTVVAAEGPLAPYEGAPYNVTALPRSGWRERLAQWTVKLEKVRGGYRMMQMLFPGRAHRLLAQGPWCPALTHPDLYRDVDAVVLIHGGNAWSVLLSGMMKRLKGPLKVATPLLHVRELSEHEAEALKQRYRPYDLVITNSDYERDWMIKRGWGEERIYTVGVGSDPQATSPTRGVFRCQHQIPDEVPLILFMGRKVFNKGPTHLVEAMDDVWRKVPEARLALVGFSYNPPSWIQSAVDRLATPSHGRIINVDDVTDEQREQALADCDVFAMPSIADSFGIAYLDAWRHGKPVIGCRDCSSVSIIDDGKDGLLVGFGVKTELAEAIVDLLGDPESAECMGKAGKEKWSERYQWWMMAKRTSKIFGDAVRKFNRGKQDD